VVIFACSANVGMADYLAGGCKPWRDEVRFDPIVPYKAALRCLGFYVTFIM
jgi:hypothetical protein